MGWVRLGQNKAETGRYRSKGRGHGRSEYGRTGLYSSTGTVHDRSDWLCSTGTGQNMAG